MKYYVTADPHGFYSPLKKALEEKGYFSDTEPHKLIICGDLFDRGKEALLMQDFIINEMKEGRIILIRGNHEDLLQEYVDNNCIPERHHISNGTVFTVMQLTGFSKVSALTDFAEMAKEMRKTPLMTQILPSMINYYETRKYIFVHGWIPCVQVGYEYRKIPNWRTEALDEEWYLSRWVNGMDAWKQVGERNKTIVCGHWHASYGHKVYEEKKSAGGESEDFTPFYSKGIIALDACTAYSGFVNCIVIEDEDIRKL